MHVDKYGQGVMVDRRMEVDDETVERTRDLLCLRLTSQGFSYRQVGRIIKATRMEVCRRLKRIPPHVRSHYEKHPLVGVGRAASDEAA